MPEQHFKPGSLVLYKIRPAIVGAIDDKIEIVLEGNKTKRVREKDIKLLHPGPTTDLEALKPVNGNVEEAWELLEGEQAPISEVAELVFGDYTPATAWAAWQLLDDGLYFEGSIKSIRGRRADAVEQTRAERVAKAEEEKSWEEFLLRVEQGVVVEEDHQRLAEVERLALGRQDRSRILKTLGIKESQEAAHEFLIKCGYWPPEFNPWALRQGANLEVPELPVPDLPDEPRVDLTHLAAYAIDDAGNTDPDDAISFDGDRLWVHVADVAALVKPDSHLDMAARERSANLYLPETVVTMLPEAVTHQLGLGLQEKSPALSFGFRLNGDEVSDIEIVASQVQVTRLSYDEVEQRIEESEFDAIYRLTQAFRAQRASRDAAFINLPEVSVKLAGDEIRIKPLPDLRSRQLVTDAMLMAGEAAARFAVRHEIPIPFAVQPEPEEIRQPKTMAEAYAYRRLFKPSSASLTSDKHFGLGLDYYSRATSPLRRYVDLVVHQQLRAFVQGQAVLPRDQVAERVAAANSMNGVIRRSERLSNQHWKQLYLKQQTDWRGEGVIVALEERKAVVIIPELAMETRVRRKADMQLDQLVNLALAEVDVPGQTAYFRIQ